tara:strand:+ start:1463 stop:2164 length:702 start_codon:yes stop_codon:yes gene_type:complete
MSEDLLPFLTQQTYKMVSKGSKKKRLAEIDEAVLGHGYRTVRNSSNRDMVTYENISDPTKKVISHRGTDTSGKKTFKEIKGDVSLALGLQDHDPEFKKRTNRTKAIVKKHPDDSFKMSGHSFGGSTATHAITNSSMLRGRIDSVDTYNAGMTPLFTNALKHGAKVKRDLKDRVTHHRVKGDIVSEGLRITKPVGRVMEHKAKEDLPDSVFGALSEGQSISNTQGKIHSLENFY